MRYLGSNASNVLGLRNLNTGNQLKAGDQTVLKYQLTDTNDEVLDLQGKTAKVYLKQRNKTIHLTTVDISEDLEVRFVIDNVLHPGSYELEIVVEDDYFFPSDNSERIIIYPSYLSLVGEEIEDIIDAGDTTLAFVREYIMTFVQNYIDDSTFIAGENITIDENNVISAIDHELRTLVGTKQDKLLAGSNISISEDGVISAVDNDTVYDDTELRQQIDDKQDELIAGENITIEDNTISAVDTVYDDTAITQRLDTVSQHIDELIRGDITIQEFMDRLSVLETDMRTIKQKTTTLRDNIETIELVVEDIENMDLVDIYTALNAIRSDMDDLREGVNDTTLENEVDGLQSTVADLSTKVDALINEEPVPVHPDLQVILDEIIADIRHLEDELADDTPVEFDDTELRARIEALEAEIAAITRDGIYDDTALQAQVDALAGELAVLDQYVSTELQATVDQLNDSLAGVSELENAILVTIPADIAELRTQVDALNTHVSDIATEYSIRALVNRMEELEGIAYYFDGASEDVKNWLFENNAKALRFSGEGVYDPENLWWKADEHGFYYDDNYYYGVHTSTIASSNNLPDAARYYRTLPNTIMKPSLEIRILYGIFYKSTLDLSNKVLSFRLNPLYFSRENFTVKLLIKDFTDSDGNVFDYSELITEDELLEGDGQLQIVMPSDYTSLQIYPFRTSYSYSDYTNNGKPVNDLQSMGLWIVDDVSAPDDPVDPGGDSTAPGEFGTLTIHPQHLPYGGTLSRDVPSTRDYIIYDGELEGFWPMLGANGTVFDHGVHNINLLVVFTDEPEYQDVSVDIPYTAGDATPLEPITINLSEDMFKPFNPDAPTLGPFAGVPRDHPDHPGNALPDPIGRLDVTSIVIPKHEESNYTEGPIPAELFLDDHVRYSGDLLYTNDSHGYYSGPGIDHITGDDTPASINIPMYFTNDKYNPEIVYRYFLKIPFYVLDEGDDISDPDLPPQDSSSIEAIDLDYYFADLLK